MTTKNVSGKQCDYLEWFLPSLVYHLIIFNGKLQLKYKGFMGPNLPVKNISWRKQQRNYSITQALTEGTKEFSIFHIVAGM